MSKYITEEEAAKWSKVAQLYRESSEKLCEIELILLLELDQVHGQPAMEAVMAAIDAVSGQAYFHTPQTEWVGGDSTDPKNTKMRAPYIVRKP